MGRVGFFGILLLATVSTGAGAQVYVQGYTNADGTYVAPHYRSAPDSNTFNNYSTEGNINPFTGQPGYKNPYEQPRPAYGSSYRPVPSGTDDRYGSSYQH